MLLLVLILTSWATLIRAHLHPSWLLNDGNQIPAIAFGTFGKVSEVESMGPAVVSAVEAGFRLIDTAYIYMNEEIIGDAIVNVTSRGIVKRKELFVSTKLSIFTGRDGAMARCCGTGPEHVLGKVKARLCRSLPHTYIFKSDVFQTTGEEYDYVDIWKGMEDAKMLGLAKSIGISNFNSSQINKILSHSKIRPAVHQIEVNPTMANMGLVAYCQSEDIRVMSYAPFGFAVPRPFNNKTLPPSFDNPILVDIAKKYGKTPSQIFLRYLIDRATIPIPKSRNKEHIRSNIDVFDFRLTRKEVYKISEFDINTAVYLHNGLFSADLFTYIFGASIEELYNAQMS